MITSINVPLYSQRDPRWANQRLGTVNGTTIGSHGCLITSIAMMDGGFDPHNQWNPSQVDNWFTDHQGYANGNLVIWTRVPKLLPNSAYSGADWCTNSPAPVEKIKQLLDQGYLCILQVGFGGQASRMHYLLAVGYDGDDIIFHDPWWGDRSRFASCRYGTGHAATDILVVHYFHDGIPNAPVSVAPPPPSPVAKLPQEHPDEAQQPTVPPTPATEPAPVPAAVTPAPEPPEWVRTYVDGQQTLTVKRPGAQAVDVSTGAKVAEIAVGTPVTLAGTFTYQGQRYGQTLWAHQNNKPNGILMDAFAEPPVDVPVTVMTEDQARAAFLDLAHDVNQAQVSARQKLWDVLALVLVKLHIIKG